MTQPATPKELFRLVSRSDPSLTTTLREAGEVDPETRLNAIRDLLLHGLGPCAMNWIPS